MSHEIDRGAPHPDCWMLAWRATALNAPLATRNLAQSILYARLLVASLGIAGLGFLTTDHSLPRREQPQLAEFQTEPAKQQPLTELLAARVNTKEQSLRTPERSVSKVSTAPADLPSRWPVQGPVSSEFGPRPGFWPWARRFHSGIDIRATRGTPVSSPAAGKVSFAGVRSEYGLTVILDHGRGVKTLYGHLQKVLVARGRKVQQGQLIALTGNSGKSSGPHLHYEIIVKGKPVNPRRFLQEEQQVSTGVSPVRRPSRTRAESPADERSVSPRSG